MGSNDNSLDWRDYIRETAIIITNDGDVYEDLNHQYCLELVAKEYLGDRSFDDNSDLEEMVKITDKLFREGKFHGFDLFNNWKGKKILASHYERAFDNEKVAKAAADYARKHDCILATFYNPNTLGKELKLVS